MDPRIIKFLHKHHVLTLATSANPSPWCANCFYVLMEEQHWLVFTSDNDTRHVEEMRQNPDVAGSVVLETNIVGKIQGIQFTGEAFELVGNDLKTAKKAYLKRFPVANLMKTNLWAIGLSSIKMTDNRLGFGKKLYWQKP